MCIYENNIGVMFLLLLIPLVLGGEFSFSSLSIESFEVEFEVGITDIEKEYFLFQGNSTKAPFAYFCRKEKQYELTLIGGEFHEIYTAPVVDHQLIFAWPNYSINSVQMTLVLKQGSLRTFDVTSYHFLSSVLSFTTLGTTNIEPMQLCEKACSYYYLIIPFLVCVLGSRYDLFLKSYQKRYGIPVESAEHEETTV